MSKIKKKVRVLKDVHFDNEGSHLSYTTPEDGGAASLKNEAFLTKALNVEESDNQAHACEDDTVEKSTENKTQTKENEMTEVEKQLQEQVAKMQHELAVRDAKDVLNKYGFEAELNKQVADVIASIEAEKQEAVYKALDALKGEVEAKDAEIEKSAKDKSENPLAKALDEEVGTEGSEAVEAEKSLVEQIKELQISKKGAK